jgi:hypothetical protein
MNDPHLRSSDKNFTRIYQLNKLCSVNRSNTVLAQVEGDQMRNQCRIFMTHPKINCKKNALYVRLLAFNKKKKKKKKKKNSKNKMKSLC